MAVWDAYSLTWVTLCLLAMQRIVRRMRASRLKAKALESEPEPQEAEAVPLR